MTLTGFKLKKSKGCLYQLLLKKEIEILKKKTANQPILSIGSVIVKDNHVVLVKHGKDANHKTGVYGIPSGKVEKFEEPIDACARETEEETGLIFKSDDLVRLPTTYIAEIETKSGIQKFVWLVYKVKKFTGNLKSVHETQPEWVKIDNLKNYNLLPNVAKAIAESQKLNI